MKNKKYSKLCPRCNQGYDPSRSTIHGEVFWLHDNVNPCKAAKAREEDLQKNLKKQEKK